MLPFSSILTVSMGVVRAFTCPADRSLESVPAWTFIACRCHVYACGTFRVMAMPYPPPLPLPVPASMPLVPESLSGIDLASIGLMNPEEELSNQQLIRTEFPHAPQRAPRPKTAPRSPASPIAAQHNSLLVAWPEVTRSRP